ncbi:hypothetical protein GGR56DRAFT_433033 [Xylariaceae sp. FL0804]|nr:hypothetical protein GGR56DRAFT_433033 [Xylariaceae sp. FL0804]
MEHNRRELPRRHLDDLLLRICSLPKVFTLPHPSGNSVGQAMSSDISRPTQSALARERGNKFYRKGLLNQAIIAYKVAVELDPSDYSPLFNLSAASFEAGKYAESVAFGDQARGRLLDDDTPNEAKLQKLLVRMAKSNILLLDLDTARKSIEGIRPGKERTGLVLALENAEAAHSSASDPRAAGKAILDLPRYKPHMQDVPDYFPVGHDRAESLYSDALKSNKDETLSFLFCGIGDGRHLFQTILLFFLQNMRSSAAPRNLHFTLVDHKPAVIARLLVFFALFDASVEGPTVRDEDSATVAFLFCTHLIPPWAWERLQGAVDKLLGALDRGEQPFTWVYLPPSHNKEVSRVLRAWQDSVPEHFSTSRIRSVIKFELMRKGMMSMSMPNSAEPISLPECTLDHRLLRKCSIISPRLDDMKRFEKDLVGLLRSFAKSEAGSEKALSDYIDKNWKLNPTIIDTDLQARWDISPEELNLDFDPAEVAENLVDEQKEMIGQNKTKTLVMDFVTAYFRYFLTSLGSLQGRVLLELRLGEMTDTLERIHYDAFEDSRVEDTSGGEVPAKPRLPWPQKFHAVHMSNIPDYVGGSLTSFLHGSPLLCEGPGTGLLSCVLRNPPEWSSIDNFNAEHLLMYDRKRLQAHFGLALSRETPEEQPGPFSSAPFVMMPYYRWEKTRPAKKDLMSRPELSRWLYAHFLKLCLPYPRPPASFTLVYSPLNQTVFLRLLCLAASLGYPAHWLSDIVDSLLSGEITTTARAPRRCVLQPADADAIHPLRKLDVRPFREEFATLLSLWRAADRGLANLVLATAQLVPPRLVAKYTLQFPAALFTVRPYSRDTAGDRNLNLQVPHFILVFWRAPADPPQSTDLRAVLMEGSQRPIHVLSTFEWRSSDGMVGFWLDERVVEGMRTEQGGGEDWRVFIWRSDTWHRLTRGLRLADADIRKGGKIGGE